MVRGIDSAFNPNGDNIAKKREIQKARDIKNRIINASYRQTEPEVSVAYNENSTLIRKQKIKTIKKEKNISTKKNKVQAKERAKQIEKILDDFNERYMEILNGNEADLKQRDMLKGLLEEVDAQDFEEDGKTLLKNNIENQLASFDKDFKEEDLDNGIIEQIADDNVQFRKNEDNISDVSQEEIDFLLNKLDKDLNEDKEEIIELTDIVKTDKQEEKNDEDFFSEENINKMIANDIIELVDIVPNVDGKTDADALQEKNKLIKDIEAVPELKNDMIETLGDVTRLPEKEKKSLIRGFLNFGYQVSEFKNRKMKGAVDFLNKKFNHDEKDNVKNKFFDKFLSSGGKKFERQAEKAKQMREIQDKKFKMLTASGLKSTGQMMVIGRIIYDLYEHKMPNGLNPFRHATAIATLVGGTAEIAKETRLSYDDAKKNTRIGNDEGFDLLNRVENGTVDEGKLEFEDKLKLDKARADMDRAWDEAYVVYENVLQNKKEEKTTAEDFRKAYRENLPADIAERFKRNENLCTGMVMSFFYKDSDVKKYSDMLIAKLDKIGNNKKLTAQAKKAEREKLLLKYDELLNDLDRMVGDAGQVDKTAYWSRVTEKVSKGIAYGLIADSALKLAKTGFEYFGFSENIKKLQNEISDDYVPDGVVFKNIPDGAQTEVDSELAQTQNPPHPDDFDGFVDKTSDQWSVHDNDVENSGKIQKAWSVQEGDPDYNAVDSVSPAKEVANDIKISIGGKIDTYSEAAQEAVRIAPIQTQDNFIHNYLDKDEVITDENRKALLAKTVRKLSVSNMDANKDNDVANLVYEGNVVRLDADGKIEVLKGEGIKEASAVSEKELSKNELKLKEVRNEISAENAKDFEMFKSHPKSIINLKNNDTELSLADQENIDGHIISERANKEALEASLAYEKITKEQTLRSEATTETAAYAENTVGKTESKSELAMKEFVESHPDQANLNETIKIIHEDFKKDEKLTSACLKIFAGNQEEQKEGIQKLFEFKFYPQDVEPNKNGILTIGNISNDENAKMFIDTKNNLIGLYSEKDGSFGIKTSGFIFKETLPTEEFNQDSLKKIKDMVKGDKDWNVIENIEEEEFKGEIQDISK